MPAGHGVRSRTRDTFSRGFRQKGYINLTTYLRSFKLGDYVDVKVNGAVHKVFTPFALPLPLPAPPAPSPPSLRRCLMSQRTASGCVVAVKLQCSALAN